jgi:hypothetical protein
MSEIDEVLSILGRNKFYIRVFVAGTDKLPKENLKRLKELGWEYSKHTNTWIKEEKVVERNSQ